MAVVPCHAVHMGEGDLITKAPFAVPVLWLNKNVHGHQSRTFHKHCIQHFSRQNLPSDVYDHIFTVITSCSIMQSYKYRTGMRVPYKTMIQKKKKKNPSAQCPLPHAASCGITGLPG